MLYVTQIVFLIYMTSTEWGHRAWAILGDLQIIRETLPAPASACGFPDAPAQSGSYRAQPQSHTPRV